MYTRKNDPGEDAVVLTLDSAAFAIGAKMDNRPKPATLETMDRRVPSRLLDSCARMANCCRI